VTFCISEIDLYVKFYQVLYVVAGGLVVIGNEAG